MITVRTTRLVRSADLEGFRAALVSLASDGGALAARDRLFVVPTHAAASHLRQTIENHALRPGTALLLPEFATASELPARLTMRLALRGGAATPAEREVLLGVACRHAAAEGTAPPFRLRPALVAEILAFYDTLRRNGRDVATFERLALGALEAGAEHDRGAERLLRQTKFLVAAFRQFERTCQQRGALDEHALRAAAVATPAAKPWRHVVVAVGDRAGDAFGLWPADWDAIARLPNLERLDVVTTDATLAGAFHHRIHDLLPGIEEVRFDAGNRGSAPRLRVPPDGTSTWAARDREEEVAGFARWVRSAVRAGELPGLDQMALVFKRPLPYVYVAREVLQSAGVPTQSYDALPLAAEPYAAAFDLVCSFVSTGFTRTTGVALLRSPHFGFSMDPAVAAAVPALDRALSEGGYLGRLDSLSRLVKTWDGNAGQLRRALPAGQQMLQLATELAPLTLPSPIGTQLALLLGFLERHDAVPGPDRTGRARQLRSRSAIHGLMATLRDAYGAYDAEPAPFDATAALVRRWIEGHTFAPRTGESGVHLVDAESARFGEFACVQIAGVVDGEWPAPPARNIFYSPAILRDLGWPVEADRLDAARASFADLLRLPRNTVAVSSFALEDDAVVAGSTLLDEVERSGLDRAPADGSRVRIFEYEALETTPEPPAANISRYRGITSGHLAEAFSVSALERYQDCPFKFFAADVLCIDELPEDESSLSPRARGRFVHEVFQRFFEEWDKRSAKEGVSRTLVPERLHIARTVFAEIAEERLAQLPESDAALERTRLFGSAISMGMVDVVTGIEASREGEVRDRLLEYRLEGEFTLGGERTVSLRGVADRIDLLDGGRLRIIDYKTGTAPQVTRALQVPIYALCAQERLSTGPDTWEVEDAEYVAFSGRRSLVQVIRSGDKGGAEVLGAARTRLLAAVDGITRGEFPPRPHDPMLCSYCAYPSVCRKDYVGDE